MGGSGGGYFTNDDPPERVKDALRREEQTTENQVFETQVSQKIGDLLSDYNNRDTNEVRHSLEQVREALENEVEDGSITPVFGGSVRKHTYVNGISDIDTLLVMKGESLKGLSPPEVLDYFEKTLSERFPKDKVTRDGIAIGLERNGLQLELLPAIRREGKLFIPGASGKKWSRIKPEAFFAKLSEVNDKNGGKVVPTIKIAKGMNDTFPEAVRLTGYHLESIAIEAFKDYSGPRNTKAMVEHFFECASVRVLRPIKDKTGQSVHVDGYAGPKNSEARRLMAQYLDRVSRRIKNANATHSVENWMRIIDQEAD